MMPELLSQELNKVLKDARNKRSGEPLSAGTKTGYTLTFEGFYKTTLARDPQRKITSLKDFSVEDLAEYKKALENRIPPLKTNSITGHLMNIKGVFKAAYAQKMIPDEINFEVFWPKTEEQYRRLHKDELDKLFAIDEKRLERMDIKGQFVFLRNKTMAAIQKDAALRASEIINLGLENILWNQRSVGGHVPVEIWESKARSRNVKEMAYLSPWGVEWLKRYLKVREAYVAESGIKAAHMLSRKSEKPMGEAVFISEKSGVALKTSVYISRIFPALIRDAGLPQEYTSHYLRHTRISEWVESGLDPKRVQTLARHESLEMTLKYYHFNEKELLQDLDQRFGHLTINPVKPLLMPDQEVALKIMRYALKAVGQEPTEQSLEAIYGALGEELKPGTSQNLYYSVHETCSRLRIGRTQLYEGWIRAGHLHPFKLGKATVFLKNEVDELSSYRTSEEASKILGFKEKVPVSVCKLAALGIIPAIKLGRGYAFKDKDLADYLFDKRSGRLRLISHLKTKIHEIKTAIPHSSPPPQPFSHDWPTIIQ